jgi:RES domain-containing protein
MRVFRVLRAAFARAPFDGEGAYRYGGRWSSPGTRVAYASEHQSLAMLEYFVHLDPEDAPDDLILATADVPDKITRARLEHKSLPANWRTIPAPPALAKIGDDFIRKAEACLLLVPSALATHENNCLLNPHHPEFKHIALNVVEPLRYDPRMFKPSTFKPKSRRTKH